jgi:ATP-dependent DNA helicase RecQ
MESIHQILEKNWGYKSFRPLQEEIINDILQGKDTLALLPTGGGKSICFQVPALAKEGICIVVSPLIALMKDQVENLTKKGIKAIAITSQMHKREIDIMLDNCVYGQIKFLYLSPERLESELVKQRIMRMNVNLIAVDEAHCVSQWGYDFRPSYLNIANVRQLHPQVPVLALTATATPNVVEDIQHKLEFKIHNLRQKSFERKNLIYVVQKEEDKYSRLLKIIKGIKGSGVVYVRNRRKTQELAAFLKKHDFVADFYHAGLTAQQRDKKQNDWIENRVPIIVCTNAFGMGIDKPNVRFVVHMDIPDSIEAYFQEAGRAGRDEQLAYAVLLYNDADIIDLKHSLDINFPEQEQIKQVYQAMANYLQIAAGAGAGTSYNFEIAHFCDTYKLNPIIAFNALKHLEREGLLALSEAVHQPSKIKFEINREDLYRFQINNIAFDPFIKVLLRSYNGLFDAFVNINEFELAGKTRLKQEDIVKRLKALQSNAVLTYIPQNALPQITLIKAREDVRDMRLSKEKYLFLKSRAHERIEAMVHYITSNFKCRSQLLIAYFGQTNASTCQRCDVCLERNKRVISNEEFEQISEQILRLLAVHELSPKKIVDSLPEANEQKTLYIIRFMVDNKIVEYISEGKLRITPNQSKFG